MSVKVVELEDGTQQVSIAFPAAPVVQRFIEDGAFVTGYFGPFGCGKTAAGTIKTYAYAQAFPGARIAVIRDTWPNLRDTTLKTFNEWLPDGIAGHWEASRKTFWLNTTDPNLPAEIMFRSMEDQRDLKNVLSLDLAAMWIDEPQGGISTRGEGEIINEAGVDHTLFQGLLARLGRQKGYPAMGWLTGNPPEPDHYIAREFEYDPGERGDAAPKNGRRDHIELDDGTILDTEFRLYLGTRETNRANLQPGYYERLERIYGTGTPMALRFLWGKWIAFASAKPFSPEWILWAGQGGQPSYTEDLEVEIVAGVDPAVSTKDTANRTAIVVVAQVRKGPLRGRIFVLESLAGHWTPARQAAEIVKVVKRRDVRTVRIEKIAYQEALAPLVEREAVDSGVHVNIELVPKPHDKLTYANGWSGLVENGKVIFLPGCEDLVRCMLGVPANKTLWDPVDSAGLAINPLPRLESDQTILPTMQQSEAATRARGYAVRPSKEEASIGARPPIVLPARSVGQNPSSPRRAIGYATRQPVKYVR